MSRPEPEPGWTIAPPAESPQPEAGWTIHSPQQSETPLRQSIRAAADKNPDRHAKVMALADRMGVPVEVVERNFDDMERNAQYADTPYAQMLRETPHTADFLSDPNNAAVAKDDHAQLGNIESMLKFGTDAARALASSFPAANAAIWKFLQAPADLLGMTGLSQRFGGYAKEQTGIAQKWGPDLEKYGFTGKNALQGMEGLGQMLIILPAALLSGQPELAAGAFGAIGAGEAYGEAREKGRSPVAAATYAAAQGTIAGALTELPIGQLSKEFSANSGLIKTFLSEVKTAIPAMQVQTFLTNLNRWTQINPEKTIGEFLQEQPAEMASTFISTLVGVIGQSVATRGLARITKPLLDDLGKGIQASKTAERLPPAAQAFIEKIAKDGPLENVFLPAEDTARYFQENKLNPEEVLGPGGTERLSQAVATGEDVQVPMQEYATRIAASEHSGFFNDIARLGSPETMNAREEKAFTNELQRQGAPTAPAPSALETSAQRVGEDIRGQLTGMGFMPAAVDAYARLYQSAFKAIGERAGVDPFEAYDKYKLKILRPLPEVLAKLPDTDTRLDTLIDRLRAGARPSQEEMFGKSLADFIREKGGVKDEGGDLASREIDSERKPFQKRIVNNEAGVPLDTAREAAAEAGYLPQQSSIADFLDLLDKEARGEPVFAQGQENPQALEQHIVLEQLDSYLKSHDIDVATASNAEIKKALKAGAQDSRDIDARTGQVLDQGYTRQFNRNDFLLEVALARGAQGLKAAVKGESGEIYTSSWHPGAIEKAREANDLNADGTPDIPAERQGFVTADGRFVTREQADKEFGVKFSEDIPRYAQYEQTLNLDKRGDIVFGPDRKMSIRLLENADLSTFVHESGHFFFEVFGDVVRDVQALPERNANQQRMVDDYESLLKHVGVESSSKWEGMSADERRPHHEEIARTFEAYLREGKAPAPELRPIFQRFKAWLTQIYRSLTQLNVNLSPEVRGIFDRLLATDDQIAKAEQDANLRAMIEDQGQAERLGLSPEEFRAYGDTVAKARDDAKDALFDEYLEEYNDRQTEWYARQREHVSREVAREVHGQRDYMALSYLSKGTLPDGAPLPEGVEAGKLDASALEDRYGKYKDSSVMKRLRELDLYRREGGVDPDHAADLFGYSSGDEMIQALLKLRPMDELIDAETTDRMRQTYGDMLTDGTASEKARDAVMTEGRSQVIQAEMKALAKKVRETEPFRKLGASETKRAIRESRKAGIETIRRFVPSVALARDIAEGRIADMKVRDVQASTYFSAARREGMAAIEAVNSGNFEKALGHKQRELVNVEMFRAARNVADEVANARDYFQGFDKAAKRERIGKAGGDYLEQIDKLLARFDFSKKTLKDVDKMKSLADFIQSEQAQGHELDVPAELQNEAARKNFKDMTVAELRGVRDAVKSIEHWANFKNKLLRNQAKRELDALAAEGKASIDGNSKGPRKTSLEMRLPGSQKGRKLESFFLAHLPLGSILREMDGFHDGGFLFENIMRPIDEAGNAEAVRLEKATENITELFRGAFKGEESSLWDKSFIPEIHDSLTKWGRLMVALNWGNDGNRQRVMGGFGWNEGQVQAVLNTLDKRDWRFVQSIWDHIGSYWPEIAAKQKRVTGVTPEQVAASPVQTQFGEMKGGYFPIVYEGRLAARAAGNTEGSFAKLIMQSAYSKATTARGHTEARMKNVSMPLRLDPGVITEHLQQVIHDLTHHEMLIDTGRLLDRVKQSIQNNYGDAAVKEITTHIREIALGTTPAPDWYRTYAAIRSNAVAARLGWNMLTTLVHVPNITSGMVRVGPEWVVKGAIDALSSAKGAEHSAQWVAEQSDMMRLRWKHRMVELSEFRDTIGLDSGKVQTTMRDVASKLGVDPDHVAHFRDTYLAAIHRVLQLAEIPTWIGAYQKAVASGAEPDSARAQADRAILDSIGGGQIKDRPAVQSGAIGKIFTTFMTYSLSMHRLGREVLLKDESAFRKGIDATLLALVPMAFVGGLHHVLRPPKKDETPLHEAGDIVFDHAVGMFAGLRELQGATRASDYSGPAAFGIFGTGKKAIFETIRAGEGKKGAAQQAVKATNELAGELFGYPAYQVDKTIQGVLALWEGRTRNPSAVLFGPPTSKGR